MPIGVRDMGFFIAINLFLTIGMTKQEKIMYAKKRIYELEELIKHWENDKQVCKKN
tara:strand:- start:19 stop:186 length:168 start_codon:yes stop_codon:yes gene_type:complete